MKVYFIGAGPGDPELVSVKALRILKKADVVLYDYLVHPNIVLSATNSERICVGKKKGAHSTQQKDINQMLVDYAKRGKLVARLKGGDPMVFGRCGEEMSALNAENIPYEIIPGITSAISVPTYAGIPMTHRDHSHSVAFVTATRANEIENIAFPNADTLVIMMSLLRLSGIVARLKELRPLNTPIAIIESGTYANERVVVGTLDTIESIQAIEKLTPPALIVVGEVVTLRTQFNWREWLPLKNQRFVISRPEHQQSQLVDQLYDLGAEVLSVSLNVITSNPMALEGFDIKKVTHIVFTSENGVRCFYEALVKNQLDARSLHSKQIVSIGQHTTEVLQTFGIIPDLVPKESTSQGIVEALKPVLASHHHVLIPTSSMADNTLDDLVSTGATIRQLTIYTNTIPNDIDLKIKWIKPNDVFIFMNSATVHRLYKHYPNLKNHVVFSIGPKTTQALRAIGKNEINESDHSSIESMIQKICAIFFPVKLDRKV